MPRNFKAMRREDFTDAAPGQLVPEPDSGIAFVPDLLPPDLPLTREMLVAAEKARGATL